MPSAISVSSAEYLRVASIAIAAYDYLWTLPAEYRFYRGQSSPLRMSLACYLFILIRYMSILVIILSNVGFFFEGFSPAECSTYFILAPVFKVLQTMVSQIIMGVRTFNISRRQRWVGWILGAVFMLITILQWFTNMYMRVPVQEKGNCTPGNLPNHLSAWLFFLVAIVYDLFTLCLSTFYLTKCSPNSGKMYHLMRVMLFDGLGYFVVLTGVNVFNLVLYRSHYVALQSAGASLGYAVTWIMSQKILIHLRDAAGSFDSMGTIVITRRLDSPRDITQAIRTQFEEMHGGPIDKEFASGLTAVDDDSLRKDDPERGTSAYELEVRVERKVTVRAEVGRVLPVSQGGPNSRPSTRASSLLY